MAIVRYVWRQRARQKSFDRSGAMRQEVDADTLLVLIAHPDDESMFFSPTIIHWTRVLRQRARILCLSTGNFHGQGAVRADELRRAAVVLGISREHVRILDLPDMQDGPTRAWSPAAIARLLEAESREAAVRCVLTFDERGVSGHANHIACALGAKIWLKQARAAAHGLGPRTLLQLESVSLVRKYCLPWAFAEAVWAAGTPDRFTILTPDLETRADAMLVYRSQLVWFRWLYVATSRYMLLNTLRRLCSGRGSTSAVLATTPSAPTS